MLLSFRERDVGKYYPSFASHALVEDKCGCALSLFQIFSIFKPRSNAVFFYDSDYSGRVVTVVT